VPENGVTAEVVAITASRDVQPTAMPAQFVPGPLFERSWG